MSVFLLSPIRHHPIPKEIYTSCRLCNFNCVKALILYILPHLDNTIFNRVGQMRNLSARGKVT